MSPHAAAVALPPDDAGIAVIGLGYVGLPLAVAFAAAGRRVRGMDLDARRVAELAQGVDRTGELLPEELAQLARLELGSEPAALADCPIRIVAVPTPIDGRHQPDLEPLRQASAQIAAVLRPGDLVIYESTVYPGTTEEICVPILEAGSGLRCNRDFSCGYSPERVSPGDRGRRLADIRKITSGSNPAAAQRVRDLYASIIRAGVWPAPSIRVAEAAKVVENIQRDVNIALVNELALVFDRLGIDTGEVLEAAGTKWNFLPFRPGLVGGHCIGVDPYYLLHKSESVGFHPELIHTAREVNERVVDHVADKVLGLLAGKGVAPAQARILVLGVSFKENCPDLRNSRAIDLVRRFSAAGAQVDAVDPWVLAEDVQALGVQLRAQPADGSYDAVVLAVAHRQFLTWDRTRIRALGKPGALVYDVKSAWPREAVDHRL
jgi:UDP-N-acetyl-D-galactosamine dehydrogenase